MGLLFLTIFILISLISLCFGFLFARRPKLAIEIQRKFYALINWRIEPISMEKEIQNTKIMGWVIILAIITGAIIVRI